MLRPEFDYERPHKHELMGISFVVRPFHRYLAIPMNIINESMNMIVRRREVFEKLKSHARISEAFMILFSNPNEEHI